MSLCGARWHRFCGVKAELKMSLRHRAAGRIHIFLFFAGLFVTAIVPTSRTQNGMPVHRAPATSRERIVEGYGRLPLSFEPNRGQFDSTFEFASQGSGHSIFLSPTTAEIRFRQTESAKAVALKITLKGAASTAAVHGADQLPGEANYYIGNPIQWITHVPTYKKVVTEDLYPGIDAAYYGNQNRFEYDFIVKPGASPEAIEVAFDGASKVGLTDDGDLLISIADRELRQARPSIYQESEGQRLPVEGRYILLGQNRIGFDIAHYDLRKPLIIDPQLVYTFLVFGTIANGIAVDSAGNAYIAGASPDGYRDQAMSAHIEKINAAGTAVLWASVFGSNFNTDVATAIAVDASGNAYVTGWTNFECCGPNFPTIKPLQSTPGGWGLEAFVIKFDVNGQMVYSTLLGGSGSDKGTGIAVDSLGNMYVTGETSSPDFPTWKPFQSTLHGSCDAFVTVLNAQGSAFIYSTYIGGSSVDAATGIAADAAGNAYVTGHTRSLDFPTSHPIRAASAGSQDAFMLRLNAAGSALDYSTYFGGTGDDRGNGIAVDSFRNAYVVGSTTSADFPTVSAFQSKLGGKVDSFVTKVNSTGTEFVYSTYLGGSDDDVMRHEFSAENVESLNAIAVNASGNAYVAGTTYSSGFPQVRSLQSLNARYDVFITELSVDGSSLIYSTLLGGSHIEQRSGVILNIGTGIAADSNGNVYVTGLTSTTDFPLQSGGCMYCVNDQWEGQSSFVAKLKDDPPQWTRFEQNSSKIQYTRTWYSNSMSVHSGRSAVLALGNGARATFAFNGTAAKWIGYKDPWSGIANVYVDGALKTQVDSYSASGQAQQVLYTITGLSSGSHTLVIEVTGTKNPSAQSAWIWVDAFDYAP